MLGDIKITCTDASFKPESIINSCWVVEGNEYTPLKVVTSKLTREQYFVLKEIQPNDPYYGGYNVKRFEVSKEWIEKMLKEELIEELIEE
jgi:hypothetical protein